ncbi:MAG: PqqD family protein [Deltaproteobacteria bacterium]|nr:PqqD family protein [Deltaproteobacteria bacterium]
MTTYTVPDDIIITELDNSEAILLDMRNKRYYSLNETGLFIVKGIRSKLSHDRIIESLMSAYDVTRRKAATSVDALIKRLLALTLLEENGT